MQTSGKSACPEASLYFHIPFCTRKCAYCHFYVLPDKEALKKQLMEAFLLEWKIWQEKLSRKKIISVYFGGGTPALFGPERIHALLEIIQQDHKEIAEVTLEANPENITFALMEAYRKAGVNRISIGIQSLHDPLLMQIGRTHNANKAIWAVETTAVAGIGNISIDLMYDLPDQSLAIWKETLHKAVSLPIKHLSLYNLTIEPHTVFFKKREEILKKIPDEEISLQMYESAIEIFEEHDLKQYEISAFAKNGKISLHNVGYWIGRPFIGFGPSAFSYWEGKRFRNVSNLNRYGKALVENSSPIDFMEELPADQRINELLAIRIRLREGVQLEQFEAQFGKIPPATGMALSSLAREGFVEIEGNLVKLTKKGVLFYDSVATELI